VGLDLHAKRLAGGLAEIGLEWDTRLLGAICRELLEANRFEDAFIYVQVTRGEPAPGQPVRSRVPSGPMHPTVFAYASPTPGLGAYPPMPTKSAVRVEDTRWTRGHVKSISLMGSLLAAMEADRAGAQDAILVRQVGERALVAEATSANLIAVMPSAGGGVDLVTPRLGQVPILRGVTLDLLREATRGTDLDIREADLTSEDLDRAREILLCGTLTMVTGVTRLDGRAVGTGRPGPIGDRLLAALCRRIASGG
jgi:D-alanine transaminase